MKSLILIILFIMINLISYAQEFEVIRFEIVPSDLTARANSRVDGNGRKCAVIKVYADDNIAAVRGAAIGDVVVTGMEKLVYIARDSKAVELVFDHHLPLKLVFEDFGYPTITDQMTYVLKLKESVESDKQPSIQKATQLNIDTFDNQSLSIANSPVESLRKDTDLFIEEFIKKLCSNYNVEVGTTTISDVETRYFSKKEKWENHYEVKLKDKTEFVDSHDNGIISMVMIDPRSAKDLRMPNGITSSSSYKEWNEWFAGHGFQPQKYDPYFMKQSMMVFDTDSYELILMFDGKENKYNTLFSVIMCKKIN